jgi:two-component system chemotaxis response regulator CheB
VAANREAFLAGARDFREYIQSGANGARLRDLDEIERDFRCFDDLGAKMTEAYAAGGAARGLALMADYDEAAADSASFAGDAGFARKLIAALLQATRRPPGSRSIARPEFAPPPAAEHCAGVIGIGASTGGTNALAVLFGALPADLPGVVVVQHMPKNFTRAFARRLNDLSALEIREADDGDPVRPGTALIAPGDRHLVLEGARPRFCVRLVDGPPINHQRPSVDALFRSMAQRAGTLAVGLLLTGMGGDGARGLLEILERGGRTIAQDEKTSVIFGMPREAIRLGAAERIAPLPMMAPLLVSMFRSRDRARSA